MNSMLQVKSICRFCGTAFMVDIDAKNKDSFCPAPACYGKITKCIKCDNESKFIQPDQDTGETIDVCDKHFTLKFGG